jgi:hypothetical protein
VPVPATDLIFTLQASDGPRPLSLLIQIHYIIPLLGLCRSGDQIDIASIWIMFHVPARPTLQNGPTAGYLILGRNPAKTQLAL